MEEYRHSSAGSAPLGSGISSRETRALCEADPRAVPATNPSPSHPKTVLLSGCRRKHERHMLLHALEHPNRQQSIERGRESGSLPLSVRGWKLLGDGSPVPIKKQEEYQISASP